jgi:hypothetical protein
MSDSSHIRTPADFAGICRDSEYAKILGSRGPMRRDDPSYTYPFDRAHSPNAAENLLLLSPGAALLALSSGATLLHVSPGAALLHVSSGATLLHVSPGPRDRGTARPRNQPICVTGAALG